MSEQNGDMINPSPSGNISEPKAPDPTATETGSKKKSADIPETSDKENEVVNEGRHAIFGDVTIIEDLKDTIPPEELEGYREDFELFQRLIDSVDDPRDKAFLSSPRVYKVIMGLDAQNYILRNEGIVLFQALRKVGATDKFVTVAEFPPEPTYIGFFNVGAAKKIIGEHSEELGLTLPPDITNIELANRIISYESEQPLDKKRLLLGYLSGFPEEAVKYYIGKNPNHPLVVGNEQFFDNTLQTYPDTHIASTAAQYYEEDGRTYLSFGDKEAPEVEEVYVRGFGISFISPHPLPQQVESHCQKLLEIERRLGVLDYIKSVENDISTT